MSNNQRSIINNQTTEEILRYRRIGTGNAMDNKHSWIAKSKDLSTTVEMTGIGMGCANQ